MLNKYDFKYILRRVIVFFTIGLIMSIIGSFKVNASSLELVESAIITKSICINDTTANSTNDLGGNVFRTYGKGWVMFNLYVQNDRNYPVSRPVAEIQIQNSNGSLFTCDIGNNMNWTDNSAQEWIYSVKCPVDLSNSGISSIIVRTNTRGNQTLCFNYMPVITFYKEYSYTNEFAVLNDNLNYIKTNQSYMSQQLESIGTTTGNLLNASNLLLAQIANALTNNNQQLQDINDKINSDNIDNNAVTDNTQGWEQQTTYVPTGGSGGSITDLLTLPIKLLQGFVNGLNSSCVPFNLGNLFGTDLILPCINISSFIGMPLWTTIDILFSGFMILHIGKKFVKIFNDFTNLRSNQMDDLYGGGN